MSAKKVRFSIAAKAMLFVTLMFSISAAVIISLNVRAERQTDIAELYERASHLGRSAAALVQEDLVSDSKSKLDPVFEQIATLPDVATVYAIGLNGLMIADGEPGEAAGMMSTVDRLAARAWEKGAEVWETDADHVAFAMPIFKNSRTLAILRLDMSLESLNGRADRILMRNILLFLVGLGISLPATALALSRAMRPVIKLTQAAEAMAARNFDTRVDIKTRDELEVLGTAFNEMARHLKTSMERVRWLAFMDDLTRMPNKTGFRERLNAAVKNSKTPGAVFIIDLDRFKRLNDTYGAVDGDQILKAASERLRAVAKDLQKKYRHADAGAPVVARLSADEFAMLITGPAITGVAKHVGRVIVDSMKKPIRLPHLTVTVTASVGVARFPLDAATPEELMQNASFALDAVKNDGGDGFRFFEAEMTQKAVARITLENELRRAVENGDFVVHYQPKVDARTNEISSCEALVRWRRDGRLVGPVNFIETAEECGLIAEIGDFVLAESCRAAARWRAQGLRAGVAVNVSAVQFERDGFSRTVLKALNDAGLPPDALELELTESVAMSDPERVIAQVEPLRAKGVRFAIDDFGTGHSSLAALTRLPFDTFKIDQTFVRRMEEDPSARVVVETILAMARALDYETVAEGVETQTQFAFLRLKGCNTAQGWLFGKPVSEGEFVERLRADQRPDDRRATPIAS